MKEGDLVQVWDDEKHICVGWGVVIATAYREANKEKVPLIQLEKGNRKIWGDEGIYWIEEKRAIEIGVRLFKDIHKRPGS